MILDVDVGNTRIKWCLHNGNCLECTDRGAVGRQDGLRFLDDLPDNIDRVRIASVVASLDCELEAKVAARWGRDPEWARVTGECQGAVCGYSDPGTLGVDRWLAILGARQVVFGDLIVVSAGSAITIDVCKGNGEHQGGYILPGFRLMVSSLISGTSGIRFAGVPESSLHPGRTTAEAVANGTLVGAAGAIRLVTQRYSDATVVVSGGDGEQLATNLGDGAEVIYEPMLLFLGLAAALP